MSKLSPLQIKALITEARKAFAYVGVKAVSAGLAWDDSNKAFDQWRRQVVMSTCGAPGLTHATNDDFRTIRSAFYSFQGRDDLALKDLLAADSEKERQLRHSIQSVLSSGGLPDEYGHSIALDKWGVPMDDLDQHQLLQLLMTLRARLKARAKKAARVSPCPSVPVHSENPF